MADPKTGKILAMSSKPSYDPNIENNKYFYNDAIANAFEPGSTMKIFTLAALLMKVCTKAKIIISPGHIKSEIGK